MNSCNSGDNLVHADTMVEAIKKFEKNYPINVIKEVVDCSTKEYQAAYDREQFDSNGRRRF